MSHNLNKSISQIKKYDRGLLPKNQYKFRHSKPSENGLYEADADMSFTFGFKLRVLLEYYNLKLSTLNSWLRGKGENSEIPASQISKGQGQVIPTEIKQLIIEFVSEHAKEKDLSPPIDTYFDQKQTEIEELIGSMSDQEKNERDSHPIPFMQLNIHEDMFSQNSIIAFTNRENASRRIRQELTLHIIENNSPICTIYGSPSTQKREIIKQWQREVFERKNNDVSFISLDLTFYAQISEVLFCIREELQSRRDGTENTQKVYTTEEKRKINKLHPSNLFSDLMDLFVHKRYILILYGFETKLDLSRTDLSISHSVSGKEWTYLIELIHELSIRNKDKIQMLLTSKESPEKFIHTLPIKSEIINVHAPSITLFEEAKRNQSYHLTPQILSKIPSYMINIRQLRLLSQIEEMVIALGYRKYIEDNSKRYIDLIINGKFETVIYEWIFLSTVNWDEYYENNEAKPRPNLSAMLFLFLCCVTMDGIKKESAKHVMSELSELNNSGNKPLSANTLNNLLLTVLVEQEDRAGTNEPCYQFKDPSIKEIYSQTFIQEMNSQEGIETFHLSNNFIPRIRFSLAKLSFRTLLNSYIDDEENASLISIYDDKNLGLYSLLSDHLKNTPREDEKTSKEQKKGLDILLAATDKMRTCDFTPRSDQILRISQIVDCLLHAAEPFTKDDVSGNVYSETNHEHDEGEIFNNMVADLCAGKMDNDSQTLDDWNHKIITYSYIIIHWCLDLRETYASTRVLFNGNKIRYSLLKRFFQLKSGGNIQITHSRESNTYSVLPPSVLKAFQKSNKEITTKFLQNLLFSAVQVGHVEIFFSLLFQLQSVENLIKISAKSPSENSGLSSFESFIGGPNISINISLLTLAVRILMGQLDIARDFALHLKSQDFPSQKEQNISMKLDAFLLRTYTALGNHKESLEIINDNKNDFIYSENSLEKFINRDFPMSAMIERYSSMLRIKILQHPLILVDKKFEDKWRELESRLSTISNKLKEHINTYNETLKGQSSNSYLVKTLLIPEYIHLNVLLCSGMLYETEATKEKSSRISKRKTILKKIENILNDIIDATLFSISPFYKMTYDIGFLRFNLYKSLVENTPPSKNLGKKLTNLLFNIKDHYPLFYCQLQILHAEYLRQLLIHTPSKEVRNELQDTLQVIEDIISKHRYMNRLFELQWLREACNLENIENRAYTVGDPALWMLL
ncbi:hypothetical protein KIH87_06215 [Paraneptunicella aestuarii]|uniref:hypothetical protein n=1 Tax=Paraneptunicella aestuarii TaxID=2831148 RepID=UPI001E5D2A6B|nr:hypothetical protein [Paraneptunicella aestuarii]UAA39944.1 hypothetical protein KIH87_06215 [Paraneptunicella aestuarii]